MQSLKELDRIKTMDSFTVNGFIRSQKYQHTTHYHFDDHSILKINDLRNSAKACNEHFEYFACLSRKQKPAG